MVNLPKIVIKSHTRLTLNERFGQFSEQQKARIQMLKNDIQTRLVEESFANGTDEAHYTEKLGRLTKDLDNPDRKHNLAFNQRSESSRRYNHRVAQEEVIVPTYRELLYEKERPRSRKKHLTYGDVLNNRASIQDDRSETHWKAEALRGCFNDTVSLPSVSLKKGHYVHPLMRDSGDEDEEDEAGSEHTSPRYKSSIQSRLGSRPTSVVHKNRFNPHQRIRRGGGAWQDRKNNDRARTSGRTAVTKEDLDRELDEYHRQKGCSADVEMGEA